MDPNHPNIRARGTRKNVGKPPVRVITHLPSEARAQWVNEELDRAGAVVQVARTAPAIVMALTEDPPPIPQVLVVDIDNIAPADLFDLHMVRERGWCGRIIALGVVPPALRQSLGIERVLNTPFSTGALGDAIAEIGFDAQTRKIPVFGDDETAAVPLMPVFIARSMARVRRQP
jgi:hypothetical protein